MTRAEFFRHDGDESYQYREVSESEPDGFDRLGRIGKLLSDHWDELPKTGWMRLIVRLVQAPPGATVVPLPSEVDPAPGREPDPFYEERENMDLVRYWKQQSEEKDQEIAELRERYRDHPSNYDKIVERVIVTTRLRKEHTQRVRDSLAEQGIELTVEQVEAERRSALETIRTQLRERGYDPPHDDWMFMEWVSEAYKQEPGGGDDDAD